MQGMQRATGRGAVMRLAALAAALVALLALGATPAFAAAPTVTTVSPAIGPLAGGTLVTITGSGFMASPAVNCSGNPGAVKFGGVNSTSCNVINDTTITATTPAGAAAGPVQVTVTNGSSETSVAAVNFTYVAAPTIATISPNTGTTTGGYSVTVTGANLTTASAVMFDSVPATSVFVVDANSVNATVPAHAVGAAQVTVVTAGGTSNALPFTYTLPPAPAITSLSPVSGTTAGGTVVTITGTNLLGTTAVSFGGSAGTNITNVTNTSLQVTAPAHAAGAVNVQVTTPSGQSPVVAGGTYTYTTTTVPVIASVTPASGPLAGGTVVTITGSGFTGTTQVTFGGVAGTNVTNVTDTSLQVTTPARATAGPVDVIITATGGTSVTSSVAKFTYAGVPTITAVSPAGGPTTGGTTVTLTGTGFTGASAVTFGGVAGTSILNVTDTSLTVVAPAGTAGTVDVLVTTPLGTSVAAATAKYSYGATVPAITSISPTAGQAGTVVTITGTGFLGATSVTFGGTAGTSMTATATSITVTAPAGTGTVDVVVNGPLGASPVGTQAKFTYQGATTSYTLTFRWSLVAWSGIDGISAANALKGTETPDNPATNNIFSSVTAMFRWNGGQQKWEAYFPGSEGVPGANDFSTLSKGQAYWIATSTSGSIVWTVAQG